MTRGARQAFAVLLLLTLALAAACILWTAHLVSGADAKARAQCHFDADLAGVPVSVSPATGKAAILGVKIVSDARQAWYGAGCSGALASPSPSFARWARYYHLPVN